MLDKIADFYEGESGVRMHQSVVTLGVLLFLGAAAIVGYQVVQFYSGMYGGMMKDVFPDG
jgi:hypothetical protein